VFLSRADFTKGSKLVLGTQEYTLALEREKQKVEELELKSTDLAVGCRK
jgi:hypothetical protein